MSSIQRHLEGLLGGMLLEYGSRTLLQKAKMIKRQVTVRSGLIMHYYERLPDVTLASDDDDPPILLLCHGLTSNAKNWSKTVSQLSPEVGNNYRMIIPDMLGHGHDLERARTSTFSYPSPAKLVDSLEQLLEALHVTHCVGYGISQGGAMVYFLQQKRPDLVERSILISPAVEAVVDPQFAEEFVLRKKNHVCVESREDVRELFQNLSCPQRKVHDPIPLFLLEAIWRDRQAEEPPGHFRTFLHTLIDHAGKDPEWLGCKSDIDPEAKRLVVWPQDDFICNHDKGKQFFAKSSANTTFHSVPDCGHLFHSNGKRIMEVILPMVIAYLKSGEDAESVALEQ
ncbi:Alpha beta hydrolase [Seminavis robusta]|uniref:Alpha beta hydrolase n=1 Tax=Seminavis robusta TaxID=568900 RepID=A0A9N8EC62_9STRA|nr:Alpha beta hydrolase [Seminavis robusta]|eukprot:Sro733_g194500.1 Alpha beta hydrolase (340) ;mRNA; f:7110-8129